MYYMRAFVCAVPAAVTAAGRAVDRSDVMEGGYYSADDIGERPGQCRRSNSGRTHGDTH